jgi:hypothetical protein
MNLDNIPNYINQVSIDCVIFGYQQKKLKVLVPKLKMKADLWTLPSGFILQEESIDQAARRILEERTGIAEVYLDQFRVFGDVPRTSKNMIERLAELNRDLIQGVNLDPAYLEWLKQRFISIGFFTLVNADLVVPSLAFFDESAEWYEIGNLPTLVLDHGEIISKGLDALRLNLDHRLPSFNLFPEKFTMKELQELYEAVYDRPFRANNFQKKMLDLNVLERLEKKFTGAANKAPYLYQFKS